MAMSSMVRVEDECSWDSIDSIKSCINLEISFSDS